MFPIYSSDTSVTYLNGNSNIHLSTRGNVGIGTTNTVANLHSVRQSNAYTLTSALNQ